VKRGPPTNPRKTGELNRQDAKSGQGKRREKKRGRRGGEEGELNRQDAKSAKRRGRGGGERNSNKKSSNNNSQ
jgi:hypothetical protein